jgi:hypothetical protein
MAELESGQVPHSDVKAALARYSQVIARSNILEISAALVVAPWHQLEPMMVKYLSGKDPAAIEAFK